MKYLLIVMIMIFLAGCIDPQTTSTTETPQEPQQTTNQTMPMIQTTVKSINFQTEDSVTIFGTLYQTTASNNAVILLHMLSRNRMDYNDFAKTLQQAGLNVLTIDLRGHGNSIVDTGSWESFTPQEFQDMTLDIKAAKRFLSSINLKTEKIVGASIGANLAVLYAAQDNSIKQLVLLSPGIEYKGLKAVDAIPYFNGATMLVAGTDDQYSVQTIQVMQPRSKNAQVKIIENGGHGTVLLQNEELVNQIKEWLQ